MATLYELTGDYLELLEMAEEGSVDDETLKDTLESLSFEIEGKADNYAMIIKELEGQTLIIKNEEARLKEKRFYIESNVKRIKDTLQQAMTNTNKKKFKTDLFSFNIAKNGGKKSLDVFGTVPKDYIKVVEENDNDKIRQALEDGQVLDFAMLKERGESLRIR